MSVTAHGKVKRYWPGKAPEWADQVEEDEDLRTTYRAAVEKVLPFEDIGSVDDPRLRRLADIRGRDRDEARADHWRIRQTAIVSTEEEDVSAAEDAAKEEDLDAVEERRRRIREKAMESRRREEEMELSTVEEEDEAEEINEYETDFEEEEEEEEEANRREMEKPVFVRKQERETVFERERMEEAERAVEEAVKRRMAERKAETKQIVVEKIREEYETIIKSINNNNNEADDDDEVNEAEEYEGWKAREIAREIARIKKRDREEDRDPMLKIKRVRKMTEHKEDERREWRRKKSKRAFMQKDYHKGAFFQDDPDDTAATVGSDEIYRRDFSAPTGEDKLNKTILPKVMQVKHFGRRGRTKWTHLVAEDTTHWTHTLRFT